MRKLEKEELVLKEEGGGAEGVDLRKLLCREAVPQKTPLKLRQLMTAGTMATAAGAALMLFYVLSWRLSRKAEDDNKDHRGSDDMSKSSRSVRRRRLLRRPTQAPAMLLESIETETLRFTYSETFEKWAIDDLASGINYFMRKKLQVCMLGVILCSSKGIGNSVVTSGERSHAIQVRFKRVEPTCLRFGFAARRLSGATVLQRR